MSYSSKLTSAGIRQVNLSNLVEKTVIDVTQPYVTSVDNASTSPNLSLIYYNMGRATGSPTLPLKTMTFDPVVATGGLSVDTSMNLNAIQLQGGQVYTGITAYFVTATSGGKIKYGLYNTDCSMIASTEDTALNGTTGFRSINLTTTFTPITSAIYYIGTYSTGTGISILGRPGSHLALNCSPESTLTSINGRFLDIGPKPGTFPTTLTGLTKTSGSEPFWFGMY